LYLKDGKAVKSTKDFTEIEDVYQLCQMYNDSGIDKIVLGCTHYPFLRSHIEDIVVGRGIEIVDSGAAVARRVEWLLERYDIAASKDNRPEMRYMTFADEDYRNRLEHKAQAIINMDK
jgi:glutamate racemase